MGKPAKLWVVDPSINEAEDQCVEQVLDGWSGESRVFHPSLRPGDGPAPGDGYDTDGVVILGSSASVYDDHLWLRDLSAWLEPIVDGSRRLPVLGVCFGHQLVAHLAGARVVFLHPDRQKELGTVETRLTGSRFLPGDHRLRVLVSHREIVESLPVGYRVVGSKPLDVMKGLERIVFDGVFDEPFHLVVHQTFETQLISVPFLRASQKQTTYVQYNYILVVSW